MTVQPWSIQAFRDAVERKQPQTVITLAKTCPPDSVTVEVARDTSYAYEALGDFAQGEAWLDRALAMAPQSSTFNRNKGLYFERRQDWTQAAACYRRAAELAPHIASYRQSLAFALYMLGQYAEAIPEYRLALAANQTYRDYWVQLARCHLACDQPDEAVAAYDRALALEDDPAVRDLRDRLDKHCGAERAAERQAAYRKAIGDLQLLSSANTFPVAILGDCRSVMSFFSAAFLGRNDVFHVSKAGIKNITLCDIDQERLEFMAQIYPQKTKRLAGDAFQIADRLASEGKRYDLVISDPYSHHIYSASIEQFDRFARLAKRWLVVGVSGPAFDQAGIAHTPEAFTQLLRAKGWDKLVVEQLLFRSDHLPGGIHWAVIRMNKRRGAKAG